MNEEIKEIISELIEEGVLMEEALSDFENINGYNILHCLCDHWADYGALEYVEMYSSETLVNEKDSTGRNPLHYLCMADIYGLLNYEEIEILQHLISKGVNINERDNIGRTPLWYACCYIRSDLSDGEEYINEIVETLIELGANVNYGDDDGVTPLHISAAHNDCWLTKKLVEFDADPHCITTNNKYLYNNNLILIDNHSSVTVPIGSKPVNLTESERIKKILLR